MKILVASFFVLQVFTNLSAQENYSYKDPEFQTIYKQIALRTSTNDEKRLIRKWDTDIKIFAEPGMGDSMKAELQKTIDLVNPLLGKIKIQWVTDKSLSNFLIRFDSLERSGTSTSGDITGSLLKANININKNEIFNTEEQNKKVRQFLLKALGRFSFRETNQKGEKVIKCNLATWRVNITPFDIEVIKLHYSDAIQSGMDEKELDAYFKKIRK